LSEYIVTIAAATREHADVALGVSPRGALSLALTSKVRAALQGRDYAIPDDVKDMAAHTLNHRIIFRPEVHDAERNSKDLIEEILARTPVPREIK
jgi:MoxR-like ATPase